MSQNSKGIFSRVLEFSEEKVDWLKDVILGGKVDADIELESYQNGLNNEKRIGTVRVKKKNIITIPEELTANEKEYEGIDCSRNLVVTTTTLFRKGPVPIEHLIYREQNHLSELGCLQEWDDSRQATSDNHLAFIDPSSKSLLTYFARMGSGEDDTDIVNLAFVDSLLKAGASMNYPDVHGQSIFFAVVRDWHLDVAYFAIEKGADVNHKDKFGRTPLHLAAAVNYAEMVEFLIDNGAEVMAKTYGEEQTPLHYAACFDSVETIKILIQAGSMIDGTDFLNRTPLHVAAETGSHEAVKFLMKLGAPTGVYDSQGNSAMFMMIEKMPHLAYEGLNQFFVEDNAMRRRYYYLDHLEFDVKSKSSSKDARTVLEAIVMYEEVDLIMHPAVQKLIDVKWKLFGRRYAFQSNFWNIFYTILATLLTFAIPFNDYDKQYTPVKKSVWKIVLAVIFFILTFYFWIKQILRIKRLNREDATYKEHRLNYINKQVPYCHPRWNEEHEFLKNEIARIHKYKSTFWRDQWNIFEWISLFLILVMFALHIANIANPNEHVFRTAKFVSAISLILVWFRLYKTLRIIKLIAEVLILLKHVMVETSRFFILFIDFYIPYIFVIYMLFGGNATKKSLSKKAINENYASINNIADVAYYVWLLTVDQPFPLAESEKVNIQAYELFIGSYIVIVTVLLVFIYIGRISEAFSRMYKKANANANLLIAGIMLSEEKELPMKDKRAMKKHMRRFCGPMVVSFESNTHGEDDDQNINIGIDHVTTKIEDITTYLRKAQFPKQEKQPINVDHLNVFETDLERLKQRQKEIEKDMDHLKEKVNITQKRTIEMIKETIETRSGKAVRRRKRSTPSDNRSGSGYTTE